MQPPPCPERHQTGKRTTALLRNIKPYYSGTYCKVKCTIHGSKVRPHVGRSNLKLWQQYRTCRVFHIEVCESKWLWGVLVLINLMISLWMQKQKWSLVTSVWCDVTSIEAYLKISDYVAKSNQRVRIIMLFRRLSIYHHNPFNNCLCLHHKIADAWSYSSAPILYKLLFS